MEYQVLNLPAILSVDRDESSILTRFTISHDLAFFKDHFPEHPVVPGVIQIEWIFEFGAEMIPPHSRYTIRSLKFMRAMIPGQECYLEISEAGPDELTFRYYNEDLLYSGGKIKFEP